jgi:hypothetical protein
MRPWHSSKRKSERRYNATMNGDSQQEQGRNGYLDLVRGGVPEEIARFGIESDPSANVLGTGARASSRTHLRVVAGDELGDGPAPRRQHPLLTLISLVLIAAWIIVPAGLIILSHTGTWP